MNNPKNIDPSRTSLIQKSFTRDLRKRIMGVKKSIVQFLVSDDVFNLSPPVVLKLNATPKSFEFVTDPRKAEIFRGWLQTQLDTNILDVMKSQKKWMYKYLDMAYTKGLERAYLEVYKKSINPFSDFFAGGKSEFLTRTFSNFQTMTKLELIYSRSYNLLKGFTDQMSQELTSQLINGIASKHTAKKIAKNMMQSIDGLTKGRALTIARTEMVFAQAEGQLLAFELLGIDQVGIMVEWITAGDEKVCPRCSSKEHTILKVKDAHGLIPLHPNCRCAWVPVLPKGKSRRTSKKVLSTYTQ